MSKTGPRFKVLAALPPLDLQAGGGMDPNDGVARCTNVLVLFGDACNDGLAAGPSGGVALAAHDAPSFLAALPVPVIAGEVDYVLELGSLGVHHGGHVLSLVVLGSGLAGRVVGVASDEFPRRCLWDASTISRKVFEVDEGFHRIPTLWNDPAHCLYGFCFGRFE